MKRMQLLRGLSFQLQNIARYARAQNCAVWEEMGRLSEGFERYQRKRQTSGQE